MRETYTKSKLGTIKDSVLESDKLQVLKRATDPDWGTEEATAGSFMGKLYIRTPCGTGATH